MARPHFSTCSDDTAGSQNSLLQNHIEIWKEIPALRGRHPDKALLGVPSLGGMVGGGIPLPRRLCSSPPQARAPPVRLKHLKRPTPPYLQDVVAMGIAEVPHANLTAHVPAAEGGSWELQPPNLQQHVGHGWEGVPAQSQLRKPLQPVEATIGAGLGPLQLIISRPACQWGSHPCLACRRPQAESLEAASLGRTETDPRGNLQAGGRAASDHARWV